MHEGLDSYFFFVMAGFTFYLQQHATPSIKVATFIKSRFIQLFPVYYLVLLLTLPFYLEHLEHKHHSPVYLVLIVLLKLTGMQSWVVSHGHQWAPTAWYAS